MNRKIGVIYSYALMLVEVFSAMLFTPFLIRMLGKPDYGVYQLIMSITSYLTLLDLGIGNAVVRFMAKFRTNNDLKKQREFLGIVTIYYAAIALIAVIVGAVLIVIFPTAFANGLTPDEIATGRKLLVITVLNAAVMLGTSSFSTTLVSYERFSFSKGMSILATLARILVCVIALKLGFGSFGVVVTYFLANVITRGLYIVYVLRVLKLKPVFRNPDFAFIKETVSYSSFVLLQMIATQINAMADSVLLGILAKGSAAIIAVYGAGAQIIQYFKTVGTHVNGVLMAGVVRLVEGGAGPKELEKEMVRIGRLLFMMLGLVFTVFIVNGKQFMILWAGESYEKGYMVAVAIMVPVMFQLVQNIGNQVLWAMNRHKTQAVIQIISALVNIVLTALLIMWKPLEGAVIGSVIALTIGDVVCMNTMFRREIKISLIGYYSGLLKGVLASLFICAAAGIAFNRFIAVGDGWLSLALRCAVMLAVYALTMLTFGMNSYEKDMLFRPLKKIKSKLTKKGDINVQG
ncbi:MAG: oligosaccharide flippase family protein [Clostridiaceae bacterium]|nr:oligosaccharide flippase family protein [Clostridiaceae bacterium]